MELPVQADAGRSPLKLAGVPEAEPSDAFDFVLRQLLDSMGESGAAPEDVPMADEDTIRSKSVHQVAFVSCDPEATCTLYSGVLGMPLTPTEALRLLRLPADEIGEETRKETDVARPVNSN